MKAPLPKKEMDALKKIVEAQDQWKIMSDIEHVIDRLASARQHTRDTRVYVITDHDNANWTVTISRKHICGRPRNVCLPVKRKP